MKRIFTIIMLVGLSMNVWAQDTLVGWTFPTGTGIDSLANFALPMNALSTLKALGGTSAINFGTNGLTTFSAQAIGWDNGMDTKYWQIELSTTEYDNLKLSGIVRSGGNNTGPRDYKIQYRIGMSVVWTDVAGGTITTGANWTTGAISDLSLPSAVENQSGTVYIRWIMTSNLDINGVDVLPTGIAKMDNIFVTGHKINVGISDATPINNHLYPNPTSGLIMLTDAPKGMVEVVNPLGQIVISQTCEESGTTIMLDLTGFQAGIYYCRYRVGNELRVTKILLER